MMMYKVMISVPLWKLRMIDKSKYAQKTGSANKKATVWPSPGYRRDIAKVSPAGLLIVYANGGTKSKIGGKRKLKNKKPPPHKV